MPVDLQCPVCGDGQGLARRVSTVPGREDIVVVYMTCESCSHEWRTEHTSSDELESHNPSSSTPATWYGFFVKI